MYVVEIGKKGRFQKRNQLMKEFGNKKEAIEYAKKHLSKGNAIAMDKVTNIGQHPIAVLGQKTKTKRFRDFSSLNKKRNIWI